MVSGGVELHVREQGESTAPAVLLVHGFPDSSHLWDGVSEILATRFRVVRYDVRGTGGSAAPADRADYALPQLARDLVAVADAVSPDAPVHLVGHDWGAIQGWEAVTDPALAHRFASFTSIAGVCLDHVPHWMRGLLRRPTPRNLARLLNQRLRSTYISFFQLPVLPELTLRLAARWWSRRGERAEGPARVRVRDAVNGLQLYRVNIRPRLGRPGRRHTAVPVQQVVPLRDRFVTPAMQESAEPWCARLWRRELPAGHWAPRTHPEVVARWIAEFVDHVRGAAPVRGLQPARDRVRRPLAGRLVLVTGAGGGIGRATALAAAARGAEVLVVDVDEAAAADTVRCVTSAGGRAHAYRVDVADGAAVHELAERVQAAHGVPDVVVANAGVGVAGPFLATSEEDWRRVVDVNLWGVVHTLRAFAPRLVARGEGGHLVVTASMAGYTPNRLLPAYSTTKAAVLMLAQCLRAELAGQGIGVSAICPGFVSTGIAATTRFVGADPEEERRRRESAVRFYRRRAFPPERVAAAVLRAVERNEAVVPVTAEAVAAQALSRLSPTLLRALGRLLG